MVFSDILFSYKLLLILVESIIVLTANLHYSYLEATFGTKFIKIGDKRFSVNSWRKCLLTVYLNEFKKFSCMQVLTHFYVLVNNVGRLAI